MFNWTKIRHFQVCLRKTSLSLKLKCSTAIPSPAADITNGTIFQPHPSFICFLSVKSEESISAPSPSLNQEAAWYPPDPWEMGWKLQWDGLFHYRCAQLLHPQGTGCQEVTVLCVPAAASEKGLKYIHAVGEKHKGFKHTFMKIWGLKKNWVTSDCYHLAHFTPRLPRNVFHMCLWNKIVSCQKENILQLSVAFRSEQFKCNISRKRIPLAGIRQGIWAQSLCFVCTVL